MTDFTLQWQWRSFKDTMWFTKMFTSWSFIEVCWPDAEGQIKGNPQSYESSLAQSTVVLSILWAPYGVTEISTWRRGKLFKSQLPFFSNSNRQLKEAHLWTKGRTLCGIRGQQQIRRGTVIGTQQLPHVLGCDRGGGTIYTRGKKKTGWSFSSMDCNQFDCQCQPQIVSSWEMIYTHHFPTPQNTEQERNLNPKISIPRFPPFEIYLD